MKKKKKINGAFIIRQGMELVLVLGWIRELDNLAAHLEIFLRDAEENKSSLQSFLVLISKGETELYDLVNLD